MCEASSNLQPLRHSTPTQQELTELGTKRGLCGNSAVPISSWPVMFTSSAAKTFKPWAICPFHALKHVEQRRSGVVNLFSSPQRT